MQIAGTSLDPLLVWRAGTDPSRAADFASSSFATFVRGGMGGTVVHLGTRAPKPLVLYQMESCPYSRLAREALSMLDLDCEMRSCPRGADAVRTELVQRGGQEQLPFLIDPNTDRALYDSQAIVTYLFERYGNGKIPRLLRSVRTSQLASKIRGDAGNTYVRARTPAQPLELYGYEASPYTRLVRERLSSYAIPYVARNLARHSPRREAFERKFGRLQFPYLHDPSNGRGMFESEMILSYLDAMYGR